MENLRQEFLNQAVSTLESLRQKLADEPPGEELKREIFRALHTLKGTSQTFDFNASGKFAHELENLLHIAPDGKIPSDKNFIPLLREGLEILGDSFRRAREGDSPIPFSSEFLQKLSDFLPRQTKINPEDFQDAVPSDIWRQLSVEERKKLSANLAGGGKFYEVEAEFGLSDFTDEFPRLRDYLGAQGEVIAVFPQSKSADKNRIGFRLFLASKLNKEKIVKDLESFDKTLNFIDFESNFTPDLKGLAAQAVSNGVKTAQQLGKEIEFETKIDDCKVSDEHIKAISHILPHLIRNAADHAIEKTGRIKVQLLAENCNLILRVSDDGRGLNAEQIHAGAVAQKLIAADKILSRDEIFELIFTHGFSTSENISEISGRGVGLAAVRATVEKLNGKIQVESDGDGTTFEVILPKEE